MFGNWVRNYNVNTTKAYLTRLGGRLQGGALRADHGAGVSDLPTSRAASLARPTRWPEVVHPLMTGAGGGWAGSELEQTTHRDVVCSAPVSGSYTCRCT